MSLPFAHHAIALLIGAGLSFGEVKPGPRRPVQASAHHAVGRHPAAPARADASDEAPTPPDEDPDRERILRLQAALAELVRTPPLSAVRVGMRVQEARSGRVFFGRRRTALMDPASNQKVLATATALLRLGADWRFRTEIAGPPPSADGVVAGDLVLRGNGDPTLRGEHLDELAVALARRGVRRVEGAVVGDPRRIGSGELGGERPPLLVNRGMLSIRVRPGRTPGAPPEISVRPWAESFIIRNKASTRPGGRSRLAFAIGAEGGRMVLEVGGGIGVRHPGAAVRRGVAHPALHAATVLAAALADAGIEVVRPPRGAIPAADPGRRVGGLPAVLAVHLSEPLAVLCRRINKNSDNDYAERILDAVGAEVLGGAATTAKGLQVLRGVIGELGLAPSSYVPRNGSGLGHANRITAEAMSALLSQLYSDPRMGPEMVQSLSVGGVDGTTRNRFRGSPAARRVRAKTGTLRGKSCLSGYVGEGGEVVVFAMLVEGLRPRTVSVVRAAQVAAVNAIMRYIREAAGTVSDLPLLPVEPGVDVESGEETSDRAGPGEAPTGSQAPPPESLDLLLERDKQDRKDRAQPRR